MSSQIRDYWIYTTLRIKNERSELGTGFLIGDKNRRKIFLLTNKHVISKKKEERRNTKKIFLNVNVQTNDSLLHGEEIELCVDSPQWREHSDPDVDVMAFDITKLFIQCPEIKARTILYDYLVTLSMRQKYDIKVADEVVVIGYPHTYGLRHQITNFPFIREGIIASYIGETLQDRYKEKDRLSERDRVLRGFLIDGAIIPGSSGSPVILKPSASRYIRNELVYDTFPPILLGIISEMRYAITDEFQSFANLGLAFDADTIRETIDQFGRISND